MSSNRLTASLLTIGTIASAAPVFAQTKGFEGFQRETATALSKKHVEESSGTRSTQGDTDLHFTSRADSVDWARGKALAEKSSGFRVIVSLQDRHVWVVSGEDTLLSAPAAVAKGTTLSYAGRAFTFKTPRGARRVLNKDADPIWNPPDWLYIETAEENGLKIARIPSTGSITTSDGKKLVIRDNRVGVIDDQGFSEFDPKLHIIFGETLYIPPIGTENRRVSGTLGKYKLNLGDGYMLHGTPYQDSIGLAATHGCVRLRDEDIEWLYENVQVGSKVYIY
jgi:L,D-transpeptidase-like protein